MAMVAVLIHGTQERTRLRDVLEDRATVVFRESDAELLDLLSTAKPDVAIVALSDARGTSRVHTIEAVRARAADLPIFAYSYLDHPGVQEVVRAARAGIDEVVLYGAEDAWIVLRTVGGGSEHERIAQAVLRAVDPVVPEVAKRLFRYTLIHSYPRPTVNGAAVAFGISRKRLIADFERARIPPPGEFVSWTRLLCAAYVLHDAACSVQQAALRSGFESAAALHGMLWRCIALRPTELMARGGFPYLVDRFKTALGITASDTRYQPDPANWSNARRTVDPTHSGPSFEHG